MSKLTVLPKTCDLLDALDPNCSFRINIDVLNSCFGANKSLYMRASYPGTAEQALCGTRPGDRFFVWMPKLYHNNSEWINRISPDGTLITEDAEPGKMQDWTETSSLDLSALRLVFAKESAKGRYQFKGVFRNRKMDRMHHSYERIATRVRLIGDPVYRIELLDDIRD